ncbi:MAG: hypothetical protein IPJ00_11990 [Saprospirales bacterium]|nr:hypothetical protein [Saprospirales bacterium]
MSFYRGSTQQPEPESGPFPSHFMTAMALGFSCASLVEYHAPYSGLGVMLQAGYDSRQGSFEEETTPCNCPANLSTNLSYFTLEPSLRFAPFNGNFYLYGGPRVAFNLEKAFTYKLGANPAFPNQKENPDVKGEFSDIEKTLLSMQVGAGGTTFGLQPG